LLSSIKKERRKLLFIHKQERIEPIEERVDIILSPAYYWFKEESLPAKSVAQAKKLAPSVFDGAIPDGTYSYAAIKKEGTFWLFAYNDALIAARLDALGIAAAKIGDIYCAQTEFIDIERPVAIDEKSVLIKTDDKISIAPAAYAADAIPMERFLQEHTPSKHALHVNLFQNSLIEEKYLYRLIALLVAVIVVYFANYMLLKRSYKAQLVEKMRIAQEYDLPQTSFELKALQRSLTSKHKRELRFRRDFKKLLTIALRPKEHIREIAIEQKRASVAITLQNVKRAEAIKDEIAKRFTIKSAKVKNGIFYVGVAR